jgi:predicted RNA-binding protein with PIN domain
LPDKLLDQRQGLIDLIQRHQPQGSLNNTVTIVFDGKSGVMGPTQPGPVKVLFSQDESADDKIKTLVYQSENKKNIVVVTNDREIQYAVRNLGAKIMKAEEFISRFQRGARQLKGRQNDSSSIQKKEKSKGIGKELEFKITSELTRIWVKSNKK